MRAAADQLRFTCDVWRAIDDDAVTDLKLNNVSRIYCHVVIATGNKVKVKVGAKRKLEL